MEPRARLFHAGDGRRRVGVRRRPGARAADRLRTLDGWSSHAPRRIARPDLARALVLVDVGPELSAKGAKVIGDFIAHNIEFDDLDVFLENVVRYDRFRTREHIARTVKYNLLVRADGKYVSKVDHRRLPGTLDPITLDDVAAITCPVLLVRGGESDVLLADAADRFVAALPDGRLVTVPESATTSTAATPPASSTPSARSWRRSTSRGPGDL